MTAGDVLLPPRQLLFLLNVAVVLSLACGSALVVAWLGRRGPALLRYHFLLVGLVLALCSPALAYLADRLDLGWIRLAEVSSPAAPAAEPVLAADTPAGDEPSPALPDVTPREEPGEPALQGMG